MLIYSDGVSEANDSSGAQYGADRLRTLLIRNCELGPSELIAACRDDLKAFCNGTRRTDDATILVLARTAA